MYRSKNRSRSRHVNNLYEQSLNELREIWKVRCPKTYKRIEKLRQGKRTKSVVVKPIVD